MFEFLKKRLVNWAIRGSLPQIKDDSMSQIADEYLKRSMKANSEALHTAQKLNRANLLTAQTKTLRDELKHGLQEDDDEDDYDDEDEEEEGGSYADRMLQGVVNKYLPSIMGGSPNPSTQGLVSQASGANEPTIEEIRSKATATLNKLDDEQIRAYYNRWGKYL